MRTVVPQLEQGAETTAVAAEAQQPPTPIAVAVGVDLVVINRGTVPIGGMCRTSRKVTRAGESAVRCFGERGQADLATDCQDKTEQQNAEAGYGGSLECRGRGSVLQAFAALLQRPGHIRFAELLLDLAVILLRQLIVAVPQSPASRSVSGVT